jgi:prepilin-type processing-associated H-X9-DG protein/prepilin-type N-terminal cleavage/methylation domain-containing protein
MKRSPRLVAGFTLVELLSVISIVAILFALVSVSYPKVTAASKSAKCLSNMRQIGVATLAYANDNDQSLPTWKTTSVQNPSIGVKLAPYLDVKAVSDGSPQNQVCGVWKCPVDPRPLIVNAATGRFARSYSFSERRPPDQNPNEKRGVIGDGAIMASLKMPQITAPASTLLLVELFTGGATNNFQYEYGNSVVAGWSNPGSIPRLTNGAYYHGKTMNFLFCDGHAEPLDPATPYQASPSMWVGTR